MKFIKKPSIHRAIQFKDNQLEIEKYLNYYQVPFEWKTFQSELKYLNIKIKNISKKVLPGSWIVESDLESRNINSNALLQQKYSNLDVYTDYEFNTIFLNYEKYLTERKHKCQR